MVLRFGLTGVFVLNLVASFGVVAKEPDAAAMTAVEFEQKEALFDVLEEVAEQAFEDRAARLEALWARMEAEEEAKWKQLEKEVLGKWDNYRPTTKKIWVSYSNDREAVSQVNFESGEVVVEALTPVAATPAQGQATVLEKLNTLVEEKGPSGQNVMRDMLPEKTMSAIENGEIAVSEPQPIQGTDGVTRKKVGVTLSLVSDHIQKRAKRYLAPVEREAAKHDVEAALVLAVMHTESAFNPLARSHVPAYGLMQLVPRFGAKEAYMQLYGEEKVLTPEYLYDPDNNIQLGVTYLGRLFHIYFASVADTEKKRFLAVSAYNWGPTAVRRWLRSQADAANLSHNALYQRLRIQAPKETSDYLQRVEKRRSGYSGDGGHGG